MGPTVSGLALVVAVAGPSNSRHKAVAALAVVAAAVAAAAVGQTDRHKHSRDCTVFLARPDRKHAVAAASVAMLIVHDLALSLATSGASA